MSLQHVSPLTGLSSGSTALTFQLQGQQNELPDVKFNLAECDTLHGCCVTQHTLPTKLDFPYGNSFC
jgi:hypothetical protein